MEVKKTFFRFQQLFTHSKEYVLHQRLYWQEMHQMGINKGVYLIYIFLECGIRGVPFVQPMVWQATEFARSWPQPWMAASNRDTLEHSQQQISRRKPIRVPTKAHRQRSRAVGTSLRRLQHHMTASSRAKPHKPVPNQTLARRAALARAYPQRRVPTKTARSLPMSKNFVGALLLQEQVKSQDTRQLQTRCRYERSANWILQIFHTTD